MVIQSRLKRWDANRDRSNDFDPRLIEGLLKSRFRSVVCEGVDHLDAETKRALEYFGDPDHPVVKSLSRKSQHYGPALVCTVIGVAGSIARCVMRAIDVSFIAETSLTRDEVVEFARFLAEIGMGEIRILLPDNRILEVEDYLGL